ncbi:MAG: PEP-CTERM sorting domain-containing protein [Oscillatoria sp. SIO1A7]|nr:PEP-CTERM sorting domain-containing protein [Oscillatoria sp. SIO1A7]
MKKFLTTSLIASLLWIAPVQRGVAQTSDNSTFFDNFESNSASIDVLWYGQNPTYNSEISELAAAASSYDPWGDGSLDWNLTFWNPAEAAPTFSDYDVFVVGTGLAWSSGFSFDTSGILNNKSAIEAARGSRTFLSGQDADLHYFINARNNQPFGFLANAVNWAGSGTGMGIVALPDGGRWWLNENSFLKNELEGYVSYFVEENVVIPTETSDFPVNEGLTTAGLSNWQQSAHAGFNKNIPGYLSINDAGGSPGYAVTIVTASEAAGGTLGSRKVPEPTSVFGLLAFFAVGVASSLQRNRRQASSRRSRWKIDG